MRYNTVKSTIILALGLLCTPLAAEAQQPRNVPRLGVLTFGSLPSDAELQRSPFLQALRELGWVEGQNIRIERRYAEGNADRLPALVAALIHLSVDVLYTPGSIAAAHMAKQATTTIPIVFTTTADSVATGLVASLARPGGNVTGVGSGVSASKRLELLKEAVPEVTRVAVLWNPANLGNQVALKSVEEAAKALGLQLHLVEVRESAELDRAFATMRHERANALYVFGDPMFAAQRTQLAKLAAQHRLPAIYTETGYVRTGGLMAHTTKAGERERRAAVYIDRLLKGSKPADLPVELATTFELVINLKTAQALGLTIPPTLLFQADEVIK